MAETAQWFALGASIVNVLIVPLGAIKLMVTLERRLTRIETKLNIQEGA